MSVIESKRILPCRTDNECTQAYLIVPGDIRNNTWNSTYQQWDAPSVYGLGLCPRPFPTKAQNPNYYCDGIDCDIRLHPQQLDSPAACAGGDASDPSDDVYLTRYLLPSLAFGVKNQLDNSLNCVPPSIANEFLTGGGKICPNEKSTIACANGRVRDVHLRQDGVLAAVYTISLFGTEKDQWGRPQYEYVICPYTGGQNVFDISSSYSCDVSDYGNVKEIQGTQPFCLGTKTNPCACVSLLLHGALEQPSDPSDPSSFPDPSFVDPSNPDGETCIYTGLYWVGVKLFYTNIDGKMCIRNPECLNITNVPNSAFASCFTPYFAKAKEYITPGNINVLPPVCGQTSGNTACWNPNGQSQGTVYLGCGLTQQTTYCDKDILHVIEISPQVALSEILTNGDYARCSIFIVLLPVLNLQNTLRR
jgi:hypothetical protein